MGLGSVGLEYLDIGGVGVSVVLGYRWDYWVIGLLESVCGNNIISSPRGGLTVAYPGKKEGWWGSFFLYMKSRIPLPGADPKKKTE